ncbi:hypothetical protein [Candidatus Tokpelaia sp.]|uniref:hypothetical protein n=1 Tax=Candidatus Tokpelaia sp. TaxID=2233777 RepID=UPI0012387398|nr:hypothetical protein [Candidatus Tokpelaia sp.]
MGRRSAVLSFRRAWAKKAADRRVERQMGVAMLLSTGAKGGKPPLTVTGGRQYIADSRQVAVHKGGQLCPAPGLSIE